MLGGGVGRILEKEIEKNDDGFCSGEICLVDGLNPRLNLIICGCLHENEIDIDRERER